TTASSMIPRNQFTSECAYYRKPRRAAKYSLQLTCHSLRLDAWRWTAMHSAGLRRTGTIDWSKSGLRSAPRSYGGLVRRLCTPPMKSTGNLCPRHVAPSELLGELI